MINQFGLTIYTDGSARGNPGRGGYGAILIWNGKSKEVSKGFKHTTNNRMELMSVIAALESLTRTGLNIEVFSDSKYVVRAVSEKWLDNWIKTDFKGGKKNKDLWVKYHKLAQDHEIRFTWVKGFWVRWTTFWEALSMLCPGSQRTLHPSTYILNKQYVMRKLTKILGII